jgi:hypothetical protein
MYAELFCKQFFEIAPVLRQNRQHKPSCNLDACGAVDDQHVERMLYEWHTIAGT